MKRLLILLGVGILLITGYYGYGVFRELRGAGPAFFSEPAGDIAALIEAGESPLTVPAGFTLEVFATDLPKARVMAFDARGDMWVTRTREGILSKLTVEDGRVVAQADVMTELNDPHGLAFDPDNPSRLYIALEQLVGYIDIDQEPLEITSLIDLPNGGNHRNHFTRTIEFGPDGKLYVAIGSSCNVCNEDDERRAKIYRMNTDGSEWEEYASGLRNTVFFDWSEVTGEMWGADMGRDQLGNDLPPDEINIIKPGKDYGWPICYGNNVHDTNFDKNQYIQDPCADKEPSLVDLPAHVAPLGFSFVPESTAWPEEYWYNALIAYHGSWNRYPPIGYKVERIKLSAVGEYLGSEPFIDGFLTTDQKAAYGRPAHLLVQPNGDVYVSDDHAGVIYRVTQGAAECYKDTICVSDVSVSEDVVVITGQTRGFWSFEGSFPVEITYADGSSQRYPALLQSEWMTEEYVEFVATVDIPAGKTVQGITLIKDNPSGLPEHDDSYTITL